MGTYTDYFAANWKNDNFGVAHWSLYGDKPGKKIWIWALSRQGEIWKNLLTDADLGNKQYVEIQTGLLFNQAGSHSSSTPFKHLFFAPNSVERFSEAWFPFKKLGGVVAANLYGSLNVILHNKILRFGFCPVQKINDELAIHVAEEEIYTKHLSLEPMEVFLDSISLDKPGEIKVILGNRLLCYDSNEGNAKKLSRPVTANKKFDWNSIGGLYTAATEMAKQRDYKTALDNYLTCLEKDPAFSPALVGIAEIYYRRMEYLKALEYISKALANDAYDVDANFIYGITSKKLGNIYDALDGFSFAARSMQYRSAANVQMAEIYFKEQNMAMVEEYANRAIAYNRFNLNALKLLVLSYRKQDKTQAAESTLNKILAIDPLNHFSRFESYLLQNKKDKLDAFTAMIRNELPHETFLELAIFYANLGLFDEAIWVLDKAPSHAMVFYWLSYLYDRKGESEKSALYLDKALQSSPRLVYPFREETAEVLKWALKKRSDWKTKYYSGLLYWSKDRIQLAEKFFADCHDRPDFAPFYLTRGNLFKATHSEQALNDYKKAIELDKNEWRAYHILTEYYNEQALYDKALATVESGARKFPANYILNFDYASALLHNHKYAASLSV
ncbi:MAG: DUF5107 domain-containing protein, partial [bacterium]